MYTIFRLAAGLVIAAILTLSVAALPAAGEKTVTLTDKDFADKAKAPKVALAKGDKLEVKLTANPTTGFDWVITSKETATLKWAGEPKYEAMNKDKKLVGSGGIKTFTFTAAEAGEAEVELHYKRSFEKNTAPATTYKFKVTIK